MGTTTSVHRFTWYAVTVSGRHHLRAMPGAVTESVPGACARGDETERGASNTRESISRLCARAWTMHHASLFVCQRAAPRCSLFMIMQRLLQFRCGLRYTIEAECKVR